MITSKRPPARTSSSLTVLRKPSGPHHFAILLGSCQAAHTLATGASISLDVINVYESSTSNIPELKLPSTCSEDCASACLLNPKVRATAAAVNSACGE